MFAFFFSSDQRPLVHHKAFAMREGQYFIFFKDFDFTVCVCVSYVLVFRVPTNLVRGQMCVTLWFSIAAR